MQLMRYQSTSIQGVQRVGSFRSTGIMVIQRTVPGTSGRREVQWFQHIDSWWKGCQFAGDILKCNTVDEKNSSVNSIVVYFQESNSQYAEEATSRYLNSDDPVHWRIFVSHGYNELMWYALHVHFSWTCILLRRICFKQMIRIRTALNQYYITTNHIHIKWLLIHYPYLPEHHSDVTRTTRRLKWLANSLFVQPFVQVYIKEYIKAPRHWPLWGESTNDRWISLTKGQ